jgi:hypothetical protein
MSGGDTLIFQREKAMDVAIELVPLIIKHHAEISLFPDLELKPSVQTYLNCEERDALRIFTARKNGVLVAYAFFFLHESLKYGNTKEALCDMLFIDPSHRGFGVSFLKWIDNEITKDNVRLIYHHVNTHHNFSPILIRQGYQINDHVFVKRLS